MPDAAHNLCPECARLALSVAFYRGLLEFANERARNCIIVLAAEVSRQRAEIDRWRDSNTRLRDEMEHQASIAQRRYLALKEISELPDPIAAGVADEALSPNIADQPRPANGES